LRQIAVPAKGALFMPGPPRTARPHHRAKNRIICQKQFGQQDDEYTSRLLSITDIDRAVLQEGNLARRGPHIGTERRLSKPTLPSCLPQRRQRREQLCALIGDRLEVDVAFQWSSFQTRTVTQ
jgi:hypothetical protein